jgi:hypothetical protein
VRARDNRHRAEELAAVVRWLRVRAGEAFDLSEALDGKGGVLGRQLLETCRAKVVSLHDAADRLERGEHHGAA